MFRVIGIGFTVAALVVLLGCASVGGTRQGPEPGDVTAMATWTEEHLAEAVRNGRLKGGVVASVNAGGRTIYAGGSGWGDAGKTEPLTGDTPMAIGSITKLFTAVAIMQLVEQGKVALDDPIGAYLPDLAMADDAQMQVTVHDLLTHHGGLPADWFADWITPEGGLDGLRQLPRQLAGVSLAAEPGMLFSYSNLGFDLLGLIVEAASGRSYDEYLREYLFEPAGMVQSEVYPGEAGLDLPKGFARNGEIDIQNIRDVPAGSLIVSASDMARFVHALFAAKPRLLEAETRDAMIVRQNAGNAIDRDFAIGLGFWIIDPLGTGEFVVGHGGSLPPAFNAILITMPELGLSVFVATNDERAASVHMELATEIQAELLAWSGHRRPSKEPVGGFLPVSPDVVDSFSGTYPTVVGLVDVAASGDAFKANVSGMSLRFAPREGGRYGVQAQLLGFIPLNIPSLEAMEFDMFIEDGVSWMGIWMGGLYSGAFSKIEPATYPSEFETYQGSYRAVRPDIPMVNGSPALSDVAVERDGDRYLFAFKLIGIPVAIPLRPTGPTTAVTDGHGRGAGETVAFFREGDSIMLDWSGIRFEKDE